MYCEPNSRKFRFTNNNYYPRNKYPASQHLKSQELSYECELCDIKVYTRAVYERHLEGKKHRHAAERDGKTFVCDVCSVTANSQKQLDVHLQSKKHQLTVEGKTEQPAKFENKSNCFWLIYLIIGFIFINFLVLFKMVL